MRRANIRRGIIDASPESLLALGVRMSEHNSNNLSAGERKALSSYLKILPAPLPTETTRVNFAIGMVGLIGSGKSTTARLLGDAVGAVVIRGDDIRMHLRQNGESYDNARKLAEQAALEVTKTGVCSAIVDSDFVDKEKRAAFTDTIEGHGGAVVRYIRVIADPDVMFSRIRGANYESYENIFRVAGTKSNAPDKAVDVRLRELWRRTPRHYEWDDSGGGRWHLRDMPFVFDTIETTNTAEAADAIVRLSRRLRDL